MRKSSERTPTKKSKAVLNYDPFKALAQRTGSLVTDERNVFADAVQAFQPNDPEPLLQLFHSENRSTITNALYVYSELGKRGRGLEDEALKLLNHPDPSARWYIIDGIGSRVEPQQLARLLVLCNDEAARVRFKMADLISCIHTSRLEQAHAFLRTTQKLECHRRGLEILKSDATPEQLISLAVESHRIEACYCYASIIIMAKAGQFAEIDEADSDTQELRYLRNKIELLKKHPRMRRPPA